MRKIINLTIIYLCVLFLNTFNVYALPKDNFLVVGNNINLREEPNQNSKILDQLRIISQVKVLKRSGKKVKIDNNEGEWVYIDTFMTSKNDKNHTVTVKGWVFDYYLSDLNNFKPMTSFKRTRIITGAGDVGMNFQFYENATFKYTMTDSYERKEFIYTGKLYKYLNVIYGKYNNSEGGCFFYINPKNKICNQFCCEDSNNCFP